MQARRRPEIPVRTAAVQLLAGAARRISLGDYHELARYQSERQLSSRGAQSLGHKGGLDDRQERLLPRALNLARQLHPPLGLGIDG